MAAVFSFGSFGDLVTLAQIANELRVAILDHRGAYTEYLQLVDELDKLISLLGSVDRTQQDFTRITGGVYDQDLQVYAETFHRSVHDTRLLIQEFRERLGAYGVRIQGPTLALSVPAPAPPINTPASQAPSTLGRMSVRERVLRASQRVRWTLSSARKEIKDFRIRLSNQYMMISMQRQETLAIMHALSAESFGLIRSSRRHKQQLSMELAALASQLTPRVPVEPTTEGFMLLTDFLGETRMVPLRHCVTRKVFHQFILTIFRQRAGFEYVQRGAYRLIPLYPSHTSSYASWSTFFQPGAEILLTAALTISSRNRMAQVVVCPKCGGHNALHAKAREVFRCAGIDCATFFYGCYGLKVYHPPVGPSCSLSASPTEATAVVSSDEHPSRQHIAHYSIVHVAFREQPSPSVHAMGLNIGKCFPRIAQPMAQLAEPVFPELALNSVIPAEASANITLVAPPGADVIATSAMLAKDMRTDTLEESAARSLLDIAAAALASTIAPAPATAPPIPSIAAISGVAPAAGTRKGSEGGHVKLVFIDEENGGAADVWYLDSAINTPDREIIAYQLEMPVATSVSCEVPLVTPDVHCSVAGPVPVPAGGSSSEIRAHTVLGS